MQYTLRHIPRKLDKALRAKAKAERKSLNRVTIDILARALNLSDEPVRHEDLDWMAGTWVEDPAFDQAVADQQRVHPDDWK